MNLGLVISKYKNKKEVSLGSISLRVAEILNYKDKWVLVAKRKGRAWSLYECEPKL